MRRCLPLCRILLLLVVAAAASEAQELDTGAGVREWRQAQGPGILASFAEMLSIPNVATHLADMQRNAEYLRTQLDQRGVETEIWSIAGAPPIVFGQLDVGASRTLGIYVHYDGQPVDLSAWTTSPWQPTLYTAAIESGGSPRPLPQAGEPIDPEWRLYGRSTADDKAPLAAIFAALDALQAQKRTPTSNLVFLFEGEEEAGSPHLAEYFRQHRDRLEVDLWLICDGPVHQSRRPQLVFGVRGYAGIDITLFGAARYLHSGHYGNWAPNPALMLAELLASMRTADGEMLIDGFYDSVLPPSEADLAALANLPEIDAELRRELGLAATEADNAQLAERLLLPSLNIRGMQSAAIGDAARNIIPTEATATLDLRLVQGNDPEAMLDLVEAHIRDQGYHIVRQDPDPETRLRYSRIARVTRRAGYPAARTPIDLPVVSQVIAAAQRAADDPLVLLPTLGGSLPLHLFTELLQAPVVIMPIANHDNNQHGPNENLRLANLWYGIDLMAAVLSMPSVGESDRELALLATWMSGSFSSRQQALADPDRYRDILLFMVPIWQQREDGPWLYVEQAAAGEAERPYRQRVYRLRRQSEDLLTSDVFQLPDDPLRWAGAWRLDRPLADLGPEDLIPRQGCAVHLRPINPQTFAGSTRDRECISNLRGASYATSEVVITPRQILSWDRGFDDDGDQVWGATAGPYEFLKSPN